MAEEAIPETLRFVLAEIIHTAYPMTSDDDEPGDDPDEAGGGGRAALSPDPLPAYTAAAPPSTREAGPQGKGKLKHDKRAKIAGKKPRAVATSQQAASKAKYVKMTPGHLEAIQRRFQEQQDAASRKLEAALAQPPTPTGPPPPTTSPDAAQPGEASGSTAAPIPLPDTV